MKTKKRIIATLTATVMTAAVAAAPISASAFEIPASQLVETKTGIGNIFTYTFKALENLTGMIKGYEDYTISVKTSGNEDYIVTPKDENINYSVEDGNVTESVYSISVDAVPAIKAADVDDITEDDDKYVPYIVKTENGKTLISSDDGKTWTEIETSSMAVSDDNYIITKKDATVTYTVKSKDGKAAVLPDNEEIQIETAKSIEVE